LRMQPFDHCAADARARNDRNGQPVHRFHCKPL
jgi:hypothetical protein